MAVKINKPAPKTPVIDDTVGPAEPSVPTPPKKKAAKPSKEKKGFKKHYKKPGPKILSEGQKAKKDIGNLNLLVEKIKSSEAKSDEELMAEFALDPEAAAKKTHRLNKEQQDSRLVLMHRLIIRKVAPKDIQAQMQISQPMYYYLREKLDACMRLDVSRLDVPYMIGDSLALYDEIRSMALVMASSQNVSDPRVKLAAMSVALKAEQDKNAFLASCGVYAPAIVDQLVHGMISSGRTLLLSGASATVRSVDQMVGDLLELLEDDQNVVSVQDQTYESGLGPDGGQEGFGNETEIHP